MVPRAHRNGERRKSLWRNKYGVFGRDSGSEPRPAPQRSAAGTIHAPTALRLRALQPPSTDLPYRATFNGTFVEGGLRPTISSSQWLDLQAPLRGGVWAPPDKRVER